jgi:hypothetical protein
MKPSEQEVLSHLQSMSFTKLNQHFYGKLVRFKLKSNRELTFRVNEIEGNDDTEDGVIFLASNPKDDIFLKDILTATVIGS